jgi:type III pantothenate kinase
MASDEIAPTLIAVDIGNSRIKLGQFRSESGLQPNADASAEEISAHWPEPVDTLELPLVHRTGEFDSQALATWCDANVSTANWSVSSVHRGAAEKFATAITSLANKRGIRWPLRSLNYRDIPLVIAVDAPERVGIDRLLSAVAADHLRRQDRAAIVVDLGTAIKVDLLNDAGQFVG